MALDFPAFAIDGTTYTDDCGNVWIYDGTKWTVESSPADSPFKRLADGTIVPKIAGDDLNMTPEVDPETGIIQIQDYPTI